MDGTERLPPDQVGDRSAIIAVLCLGEMAGRIKVVKGNNSDCYGILG